MSQETRNWISMVVGVVITCGIFGADLLHFHQVGSAGDVGLIVGALAALGIHTGFVAGINSTPSTTASSAPTPTPSPGKV